MLFVVSPANRQVCSPPRFKRLSPRCVRSGRQIKTLETDLKELDEELDLLLLQIPNIPLQDVPSGADESGNVLIKTVGERHRLSTFNLGRTGRSARIWASWTLRGE